MKKYIYMLGIAACMLTACTNLDETIYSQLPKEEFFSSEAQLNTYSVPIRCCRTGGRSRACGRSSCS